MSKKQYIEAFSNIHPSDESIERIMSMTDKKHVVSFRKTLLVLAAIITVLFSLGLVANAATDGAFAESVSEVIEASSNKINVLVNGKKTEAEINVTEKTDSNGETSYVAEVHVETPDSYAGFEYEFQSDDDTDVNQTAPSVEIEIKDSLDNAK